MRLLPLLIVMACAGSAEPAPAATEPESTSMPAPIDVCVEENATLTAARAEPSRAGVYDPDAPIVPEHLNWMVPSFCVSYPGGATRRAQCGDRAVDAPVVTRVLCQQ